MGFTAAAIMGIAGAAIGAGGAYMASQGSGESRSIGELGQMPVGMYGDQLSELAGVQFDMQRDQAMLDLQLYPAFAAAQRQAQRKSALMALQLYPRFTRREREETSKQRGADLSDLSQYGPGYAAMLERLSPGYAALGTEAGAGANRQILDKLRGQALSELDLGGELSADELRNVQQGSRAAFADRGMEYSNPALATEILGGDAAMRARMRERQGFASGIQNMEEASAGNRTNQLIAGSQARLNPILAAFTRTNVNPSIAAGPAQLAPSPLLPAQVMAMGPSVQGMSQAISPLYNYGADVYGTNFNAAEAHATNAANAVTSIGGGLMSFGGSLYGGGGGGGAGAGSGY